MFHTTRLGGLLAALLCGFIGHISAISAPGIRPGFGLSQSDCETLVSSVGVLAYLACFMLILISVTAPRIEE